MFDYLVTHTTAPGFWKTRHVGVQCHKSGSGNCFGDIFSFHLEMVLAGFLVEEHVGENCGELSSMIYHDMYIYIYVCKYLHVCMYVSNMCVQYIICIIGTATYNGKLTLYIII